MPRTTRRSPSEFPSPVQALPFPREAFRRSLLAWYQANARPLPWRATSDPYRIWLAEVMLQQTTVAAVIPYYHRFLARFPDVATLAAAPIDDVLHLWQGLGYYRRAHLLHRCAQTVMTQHQGFFPTTESELLALPGFGPYTAAAVASQAFAQPAAAVDGNVERVVSRIFAVETPLPRSRPLLRRYAQLLAPLLESHEISVENPPTAASPENAGIIREERDAPTAVASEASLWTNALIELGATVCQPKTPLCASCPVSGFCAAYAHGNPTAYPLKDAKKPLPEKSGTVMVITGADGHLYLRRRPPEGLLGGLFEFPHTGWEAPDLPLPFPTHRHGVVGTVVHTFTHFRLTLTVEQHTLAVTGPLPGFYPLNDLPPLPTLMRNVLKTALAPQASLPL